MTIALIAVNVTVFAWEWTLPPDALADAFSRLGYIPAAFLASPASPEQLATLLTSMFMHGGVVHVGGNMLYLWIFGNNIEDRLGPGRFLLFYLAAGLAAIAAQTAVGPDATIPTIGASGAVAGVLGAYLVCYPRADVVTVIPLIVFFEVARLPAYLVIGFWFLLQLANGLVSLDPGAVQTGGIAWFAHIGGFVLGLLLALPLRRRGAGGREWR